MERNLVKKTFIFFRIIFFKNIRQTYKKYFKKKIKNPLINLWIYERGRSFFLFMNRKLRSISLKFFFTIK